MNNMTFSHDNEDMEELKNMLKTLMLIQARTRISKKDIEELNENMDHSQDGLKDGPKPSRNSKPSKKTSAGRSRLAYWSHGAGGHCG